MNISGLLSGIALAILGGIGIIYSFVIGIWEGGITLLILGMILLCTGLYMIFNHNLEDKIENISTTNKYRNKFR